MDNTRIMAAREAGVKVEANVHNFNDRLSSKRESGLSMMVLSLKLGRSYPATN